MKLKSYIVVIAVLLVSTVVSAEPDIELLLVDSAREMIGEAQSSEERDLYQQLLKERRYDVFAAYELSELGTDYVLLRLYSKRAKEKFSNVDAAERAEKHEELINALEDLTLDSPYSDLSIDTLERLSGYASYLHQAIENELLVRKKKAGGGGK